MLSKNKIKFLQSLGQKKVRNEEGLFIIEGPKLFKEALNSGLALESVYYTAKYSSLITDKIALDQEEISEDELKKISQLVSPDGVLAVATQHILEKTDVLVEGTTYLLLDGIRDPGNMGTLLRLADWFGIQQVICSDDCVDIYNSKVVQASMGSIFRVKVGIQPLDKLIEKATVPVYAAVLDGKPVYSASLPASFALLMGSESHGINEELLRLIQEKIAIPGFAQTENAAESLNVATAAAILLSEFKRRVFLQ